jgi:hypothetical protein
VEEESEQPEEEGKVKVKTFRHLGRKERRRGGKRGSRCANDCRIVITTKEEGSEGELLLRLRVREPSIREVCGAREMFSRFADASENFGQSR